VSLHNRHFYPPARGGIGNRSSRRISRRTQHFWPKEQNTALPSLAEASRCSSNVLTVQRLCREGGGKGVVKGGGDGKERERKRVDGAISSEQRANSPQSATRNQQI